MKIYIITLSALLLSIFIFYIPVWASCAFDGTVWGSLDWCLWSTDLVDAQGWMELDGGFRTVVLNWVTNIAWLLSLLAIWAIVYGAFLMTLSGWEDERIKKWKDIVKWSLLWFLALISSPALVRLVIEFIYSVAW